MPGLLRDLISLYQNIQDPDKDKRNRAMAYYAANPQAYQQLIDSHQADDPNVLKQIFGSDARFGGNSNASSNIINNIRSSPLSEVEKANRLEDVQNINPNDIANSSVTNIPSLRAFNGMSNGSFQTQVPSIASAIQNNAPGSSAPPTPPQSLLSQQQKDMLGKQRTGETSLDQQKSLADIGMVNAERDSAIANAARTKAATPGDIAQSDMLGRKNSLEQASDQLVDSYYTSHPESRAKNVVDILNDKTVSPDVRAAFINSGKYGDSTKTLLAQDMEKQRLALEKRGQDISLQERQEWLPKLQQSSALEAYMKQGAGGNLQGYLDLFQNKQSPAADAAKAELATGTPAQKIQELNQYNSVYKNLQNKLASKTLPSNDNVQNTVDVLNNMATLLNSRGINTPIIKYDATPSSRKGVGSNIAGVFESKASMPHSLQTINGDPVVPPIYNPKQDPANFTKSGNDIVTIQKKAALYEQIKKQNPNMPPQAIQAQVEAQFAKGN